MLTIVGTWSVIENHGQWVLNWQGYGETLAPNSDRLCACPECTEIAICPSTFPETLAVDAALEFMDRYIEGRFPREIESEKKAMQFCFQTARRQR